MTESLFLTFAEIEFLLRAQRPVLGKLREALGLEAFGTDDAVARAGSASLLARGLCTYDGVNVVPSADIVGVIAGLSTADAATRAVGWIDGAMALVHLLTGPGIAIALFKAPQGQFAIRVLDPDVSVADQLSRFVDSCLTGAAESAVIIQSRTADVTVGIAVARDGEGAWFVSDSENDPDSATRSTRDGVVARIGELLPAGAR
jgi:hypothetical protein